MYQIIVKNIKEIEINKQMECFVRYNDSKMKNISLKAWSLLFEELKKQNIFISSDNIIFNNKNKPYLKNNEKYFNISHSKDLIAILISDKECGIDIEYIDYDRDINKISNKVFSKKEYSDFKKRKDKHKFFYKKWTQKEAYFKKIGTGIEFNKLNNDESLITEKTYIYTNKNDKYYISISC